jgi:hypothetical protein
MNMSGKFINCHRMRGSFYREDTTRIPVGSLQAYRGDSITLSVSIKDELEDAADLTNAFIRFGMKYEEYCDDLYFSARSDQGNVINILNPTKGLIEIKIPYTETENWDVWPYWFDIEVTTEDNHRQTVIKGRIDILPDITT